MITGRREKVVQYYRVRSILSSRNSTAVTLAPVEWLKESETRVIEVDGDMYPDLDVVEPSNEATEVNELGGPMTELRIPAEVEIRTDEYVTLTMETYTFSED